MALQTFACPACGSRKSLEDAQPGEKLHCTCGMSFPASPVFAVSDGGAKKGGGSRFPVLIGVLLVVALGGVAVWMTRQRAPTHDQTGPQVATVTPSTAPQPKVDNERPTPVPPGDTTSVPPPPDQPTPENPVNSTPAVKPPPPLGAPVASVSAETLWDAYDLGPAVAARYTGKVVEVKAHGRVARDTIDRPYFGAVVVKATGRTTPRMSAEQRQWEKEGYPPSVRCYLAPDQAAPLEKEGGDQDVVLRGICTGRKDRDDVYRGYIVELDNCVVVTPK